MPPTPTDIPTRQNNPGDLRTGAGGAIGTYQDPKQGMAALVNDLYAKQTGNTSTGLTPTSTLADFAAVYAPKSDGNDPAKYTADLANQMGVSPTTQLKNLDLGKWADAVSSNEGFVAGSSQGNSQNQIQSAPVSNNVSDSIGGYAPPPQPGQANADTSDDAGGYAPPPLPPSQTQTSTPPPTTPGYLSRVGSDISGAVQQGAQDLAGNADIANSNANLLQKLGSSIDTGLNVAGDVAGAVASPIAEAVSPLVKGAINAIPGGAAAASSVGSAIGGVAQKFPNAARAVGDVANIAALPLGGEGGGILSGAAKGAKGLIGGAEDATISKAVQDAMPLENKATRVDALRSSLPGSSGGVVRKGLLGTSTITPDAEDVARGTAAAPFIGGTKDSIAQIQNLNKGIQDSSKATDSFLDSNAAPANFADMRKYMETNLPTPNLQNDPAAMSTYSRVTNEALETLYQTMKKTANATGDFGAKTSGSDIRQARIAIDQKINNELGESTFGSPQYKGVKAAAVDTRNLLNRMSEDMLRYPGQMENLNKMNEFVNASKERGIDVDMNNPEIRSHLEKQFGLSALPENEANAQALSGAHKNMSHLYDARDNIIDKYQKKIGKNKLQEAAENNPLVRTGIGIAKKAIPFGVAEHFI